MITLGEIRDIKRRLKISRLIKVTYIIAYDIHSNIKVIVNYCFSDGFILSYTVDSYYNTDEVRRLSHRRFIEYRDYVKMIFPDTSPVFELCNYVTQI